MVKDKDVLIIGQGIAGTVLAFTLRKYGYSYAIVDKKEECTSSLVAAGVFNPFTGRKLTKTWRAEQLFPFAISFYKHIYDAYGIDCMQQLPIYRAFSDVTQFNDFSSHSTDPQFNNFIDRIHETPFRPQQLKNEMGGVLQKNGGWVDVRNFILQARTFFESENTFIHDEFEPSELNISTENLSWKGINAKKVVLAGGYQNSLKGVFDWLPFVPTKGEMLEISVPDLPGDMIYNKGFFLLPQRPGIFLAGATFSKDTSPYPTQEGKKRVEEKITSLLHSPYQIKNHVWGIRPTVKDRRPLVGWHPVYKNIGIFNGLGTKGVTLAPFFAQQWVESWQETHKNIDEAVNIQRYYSLRTP